MADYDGYVKFGTKIDDSGVKTATTKNKKQTC